MNMPTDLQILIKEYSMPIYRKPPHFLAIKDIDTNNIPWILADTPYTQLDQDLAGWDHISDIMRACPLLCEYMNSFHGGFSLHLSGRLIRDGR